MYERYLKRILDLLFAVILFGIFIIPMGVIYISIKFSSKGAAIFKQKRLGKGNKEFYIYKFRTMRNETEINKKILSDVERTTKVGEFLRKFSLDELPQIVNVLKGEMSFIGPRPLHTTYLELYSEEQKRRHDVIPGISGWAQINGRNCISWNEKFKYDVEYVNKLCFMLDLKIFIKTLKVVLVRTGVNNDKITTMEYFTGNSEE